MSQLPAPAENGEFDSEQLQRIVIIIVIALVVVGLTLIGVAIFLALNASTTAAGVEVVRDVLIIVLTLQFIVIGVAFTVLLIQVARFVNLLNNEVQPIIESTKETVNILRGTAVFISRNVAQPAVEGTATVRGLSRVLNDVDAIRKAANIIATASTAAASTPIATHTSGQTPTDAELGIDENVAQSDDRQASKTNDNENTDEASSG